MKYLKVSSVTDSGSLAGAIAASIRKGEEVEVVSVGASALNQAVKAVVIAREFIRKERKELAMEPKFSLAYVGEEEKTAISLHVFEIFSEEERAAG